MCACPHASSLCSSACYNMPQVMLRIPKFAMNTATHMSILVWDKCRTKCTTIHLAGSTMNCPRLVLDLSASMRAPHPSRDVLSCSRVFRDHQYAAHQNCMGFVLLLHDSHSTFLAHPFFQRANDACDAHGTGMKMCREMSPSNVDCLHQLL